MARTASNSKEKEKVIKKQAKQQYWKQQSTMWEAAARIAQEEEYKKQEHEAIKKEAARLQVGTWETAMKFATNHAAAHRKPIKDTPSLTDDKEAARKKAVERFKKRKQSGSIDIKNSIPKKRHFKKSPPNSQEHIQTVTRTRKAIHENNKTILGSEALFSSGNNQRTQYYGGANHYGTSPDPTGRFHTPEQRKKITAMYRNFGGKPKQNDTRPSHGRSF